MNMARRERVIHSTVVQSIESDLKKNIYEYKKAILRREQTDVELRILKDEHLRMMALIEFEEDRFKEDCNRAVIDEQPTIKTLQSNEFSLKSVN